MVSPGLYRIGDPQAEPGYGGSKASSRGFKIHYPGLDKGADGPAVKTLNTLLGNLGYVNGRG